MATLADLPNQPVLHAIAIDNVGGHTGVTTSPQRHYLAWEEGRSSFVTVDCDTTK